MNKKIKQTKNPFLKPDFNPKNKTHRFNLYQRTFMKHNVESRLFTLQKEAINLTTQTLATALNPNKENLLNLAEAIGDVETCIEIIKLTIPKLTEASTNIKHGKLQTLKNRTDEADKKLQDKVLSEDNDNKPEHEQLSEASVQAEKAIHEFNKGFPDKKSFFGFFKHCWNY